MKSENVLLALQRATHTTSQRLLGELDGLDLTVAEINVLVILSDGNARGVSELAAEVGARASTMTSVLDRLQKRGYLARSSPSLRDRRVVLVLLTEPGQDVAARIRKTVTDLEQRALSGLPESAVAGFHKVLRALSEAAQ